MADPFDRFRDLLGLAADPVAGAQASLELIRLKAKAARVDELEGSIAVLKRKSQHLLDVAYNRALDDLLAGEVETELWARANRLRRTVRHAAEFAKKTEPGGGS